MQNDLDILLQQLNEKLLGLGMPELVYISPLDILPQEVNARYFKPEVFQQLVDNIKSVGHLESVPLVYRHNDKYKCISGHHRVKAAVEAGLQNGFTCLVKERRQSVMRIDSLAISVLRIQLLQFVAAYLTILQRDVDDRTHLPSHNIRVLHPGLPTTSLIHYKQLVDLVSLTALRMHLYKAPDNLIEMCCEVVQVCYNLARSLNSLACKAQYRLRNVLMDRTSILRNYLYIFSLLTFISICLLTYLSGFYYG